MVRVFLVVRVVLVFMVLIFQDGNPKRTKMSSKYERHVKQREGLMEQFERGDIGRKFYLRRMGALSLKADKAAKRMIPEYEDAANATNATPKETLNVDSESDDSLSETRPEVLESDTSSTDQEDPFSRDPVLQPTRTAAASKKVSKKTGPKKKELCQVCKKGFQLRRVPPLHIACSSCSKLIHKRCRDTMEEKFVCMKCRPASGEVPSHPEEPNHACPDEATSHQAPDPANNSCCEELLLAEDDVIGSPCLPSYQDYAEKFDARMMTLGFERSPSQRNTVGDGNCGIYSLLDQLNLPYQDSDPIFGVDDSVYARFVFSFLFIQF